MPQRSAPEWRHFGTRRSVCRSREGCMPPYVTTTVVYWTKLSAYSPGPAPMSISTKHMQRAPKINSILHRFTIHEGTVSGGPAGNRIRRRCAGHSVRYTSWHARVIVLAHMHISLVNGNRTTIAFFCFVLRALKAGAHFFRHQTRQYYFSSR